MTQIVPTKTTKIRLPPADSPVLESLSRNPAFVYLATLRPTGRLSQAQALNVIAEILGTPTYINFVPRKGSTKGSRAVNLAYLYCNWAGLRYEHTAAIRERLSEQYSAATVNKMLCALRGVMKSAWRLGLMKAEDYQRAADVQSLSVETLPAGRALSQGELSALLEACEHDDSPAGPRDAAIIALLAMCGLRRGEVTALDLSDYYLEDDRRIVVHGKRNKNRNAYIYNGAAAALEDWLTLRGNAPGPLFCEVDKSGALRPGRLSTQAIYGILRKRAEQAKLAQACSPHDLRRTFISNLLDAGVDIAIAKKLAGHSSIQTTERYDRRPESAKQEAVKLLHFPYRKRFK